MIPFVDLREEYKTIEREITESLAGIFEGGSYILGEHLAKFENEFANFSGAHFGVGVASGMDAIRLTLTALDIGSGDEVITVSNTAAATALAICASNATPVFVDVHPASYTIDPQKIEAAVTSKTRAIMSVHLYGHPADMHPILEVAQRQGLIVIEDAAQAHGAEYKGQKIGTLAQLACFSFYPTKNLGA